MRGTSAESLKAALAVVEGAKGDLGAVGDELFAATAAIDGAPALRRVLTDPSTESAGKQSLVADVFGGKLSKDALAVLTSAVGGRWAEGRDLGDALEIAGVAAWIRGAGKAQLDTELFEAGRIIHDNADLRSAVEERTFTPEAKAALLTDVFATKVSPAALALLKQAAVARTSSFENVLTAFTDQVAEASGRSVATVRVAYALDAAESKKLAAALQTRFGKPVQLNLIVDPSVVGGISVSIDGSVVDATMSTRLEDARRRLAG